jgi:hypothetical protein
MTTRKKKTEVHLIRYFGGPGVQQVAGKKKRPRRYAQATRARRCLAFHCCWLGEGEPKKKIWRRVCVADLGCLPRRSRSPSSRPRWLQEPFTIDDRGSTGRDENRPTWVGGLVTFATRFFLP